MEDSELLTEIGIPEVDIYIYLFFSFFVIFSKTGFTFFFKSYMVYTWQLSYVVSRVSILVK